MAYDAYRCSPTRRNWSVLSNTAKRPGAPPNYLSGTGLSHGLSNAYQLIQSSISLCRKATDVPSRWSIISPLCHLESHSKYSGHHYCPQSCRAYLFCICTPRTLHSDGGREFENDVVKELQKVYGYKNTRTAAYRPQGNPVLGRVHSTVHNMVATYSTLKCDKWAKLLPYVQLTHNTAYSSTPEETPQYLVLGRAAVLPVDLILGVPATTEPQSQPDIYAALSKPYS